MPKLCFTVVGLRAQGSHDFFLGSTGMEIALHDALCSSLRHALAETSAQEDHLDPECALHGRSQFTAIGQRDELLRCLKAPRLLSKTSLHVLYVYIYIT